MFDPKSVRGEQLDLHLPPVAASALTGDALRRRFAQPPVWVPELRSDTVIDAHTLRSAAVLMALVQGDQPRVVLTTRPARMKVHPGQIAFPGGKVDERDDSRVATALREAHEEVGLSPAKVEVLGQLPEYVTTTGFRVTPVVGLVAPSTEWHADPNEVDEVFEVPLVYLMNPSHHWTHEYWWQGHWRRWYSMPYQDQGTERWIWGATAGMLRNFYRFLVA